MLISGLPIQSSLDELNKGPHIIIGTPDRVLDMHARDALAVVDCKWIIWDEAEALIDRGFERALRRISLIVPKECKISAFCSTLAKAMSSWQRLVCSCFVLLSVFCFVARICQTVVHRARAVSGTNA